MITEFIFEETQAQADVLRNVLVIDNLEEQTFIPLKSGATPVWRHRWDNIVTVWRHWWDNNVTVWRHWWGHKAIVWYHCCRNWGGNNFSSLSLSEVSQKIKMIWLWLKWDKPYWVKVRNWTITRKLAKPNQPNFIHSYVLNVPKGSWAVGGLPLPWPFK